MENALHATAKTYERAYYTAAREAEQAGEEPPRLVSVFARAGGYSVDFVAPARALPEVRRAIISAGGEFRAAFI